VESHGDENIDAIVVLPVTAPLRSVKDVDACIDLFEEGGVDSVITVSEANRSPYFNMTVNDDSGYASLVISPENQIIRRQDAPEVFDMTTVAYVVNTYTVKLSNSVFESKVKSIIIPQERSVDIDTLLDFKIAEYLALNG
jgi:N-acylneuraminate cytidylyltransferase